MPIRFACPSCGMEFETPDTLAGKQIKCKHCTTIMLVPGGAPGTRRIWQMTTGHRGHGGGRPAPAKRPPADRP